MTSVGRPLGFVAIGAVALISWTASVGRADIDPRSPLALDSPERRKAPSLPAEPAFSLPPIHAMVLDNGVRMLLVERHELPIASLRVITMRGVADAPPGVGSLASGALFLGTSARSSGEIGVALRRLGVLAETGYSYDAIWLNVELLSSRLGDVLSLVGELLQYPQVPVDLFESERAKRLARIAARRSAPHALIHGAIDDSLYPQGHPYRESLAGDETAIKGATYDQVMSFFQTQVKPDTTVVVVAGDVERFKLENMIRRSFGNWKGQAVPRRPIPDVTASPAAPRAVLVDRWGATQATVMVGEVGVSRNCPDRDALPVINAILGARSGRLSTELRETLGSTYGA